MASDTKKHILSSQAWVDISSGATFVSGVCLSGSLHLYYGSAAPDIKSADVVPLGPGDTFSLELPAGISVWAKAGDSIGCDVRVMRREG